jgi:putative ABC transport system substrate-binding protein
VREIHGREDLAAAFADAARASAQAAVFMTDNALFAHRSAIAELALVHHLPTIHSFPPEVQDGGLMSFSINLADRYRRAAAMADRILRGALPAEIPVEQPTTFTLAINMRTAGALGIVFPPAILVRADEVIE